jgi:hypothetical protein
MTLPHPWYSGRGDTDRSLCDTPSGNIRHPDDDPTVAAARNQAHG